MQTRTSLLHFVQRGKCLRMNHLCFSTYSSVRLTALNSLKMELNHECMDGSAGVTFSVKLSLFRNFLFFKPLVPAPVYLLDTLWDCVRYRFSWCICMYNRNSHIVPSPATEPICMVCAGIAESICNVRSIASVGLQLFVLDEVSLVNLEHEEIIFAI